MKKFIALLFIVSMLLTACGDTITIPTGTDTPSDTVPPTTQDTLLPPTTIYVPSGLPTNTPDPTPTVTPDITPSATPTPTNTPDITPTPTPTVTEEPEPLPDIVINEVMADNKYLVLGNEFDWIEIFNKEETEVSLDGFYISDSADKPWDLSLKGLKIPAGGYLLLVLEEDANFHLSSAGESVYIFRNKELVTEFAFGEILDGESVSKDGACKYPTPGYPNTEEGYLAYLDTLTLPELIISEVISSNMSHLPQNGKYYDIVEIQNTSDSPISLGEYTLSDKRKEPERYKFPDITLSPGEFFVIFCSGETKLGNNHTSFKISSSGENIFLFKNGVLSDVLQVPSNLETDKSFGRDGTRPVYLTSATPGKDNSDGYLNGVPVPTSNLPSGIYESPITVTLTGTGNIHYTLDGSKPTQNSEVYNGAPIEISSTTAVRAIMFDDDNTPSDIVTFNYFINIPDYSLPIIKISMNNEDIFGADGIYPNYNKEIEKEANCSFYVEGTEEFSIDCGIKIFGKSSRAYSKKSFQLEFRKEYGNSKLNYPLFYEEASFSNIVLRSGSQGAMATESLYTDEFLTSLAENSGDIKLTVQKYRPCNVYINGEYFGIYFIREKIDSDFIADKYDISEEGVTLISDFDSLMSGPAYSEWKAIWDKVYTKKVDFSNDENYKWLCDRINIESYSDLIIMKAFSGDLDIMGNVRLFKSDEYDGGKWNFIYYDNDLSFQSKASMKNRLYRYLTDSNGKVTWALFRALIKNDDFKAFFLQRLAHHLNNSLAPERTIEEFNKIVPLLEHDMPYQIDRWKHDSFYIPSMKQWNTNLNRVRTLLEGRIEWFVQDVSQTLSLSKEDIEKYMGAEFVKYLTE